MNEPNENNKIGGRGKVIPSYVEPMNSPYHTTSSKQIHSQGKPESKTIPGPYVSAGPSEDPTKFQDITPPANIPAHIYTGKPAPQPLIDLQIYPDPKTKNPLADKQAALPLQPFALSSPFIPPQFQSYLNNFMKNFYTPFIYKDYHINLGGPDGDHITGSLIYEDALPPAEIYSSYKTLKERNGLCNYVRGTFISVDEGEFVDFKGGPNSLNSRLKLIQLNPYNTNLFSANPYKSFPKVSGLYIYKSCYPIVHDKANSTIQCNKMAVGMNVRVYDVTMKEFVVKFYNSYEKMSKLKIKSDMTKFLDAIARELGPGKKIEDFSPELVPIKYNIWREIDFYSFIRNKINLDLVCPNFVQSYCYFINTNANMSFKKNTLTPVNTSLTIPEILSDDFSNSTMILLTESPNQNLYQWGSNSYVQDRGVRKMVYSGYKQDDHWKSVIAQMLITFYVMNKYKFTIREMSVETNFYLKDLNVYGDNKQYWQYTIGGIDYYIPNYGHLLMCDHNYKDLIKPENLSKYKVIAEAMGDEISDIKKTITENAFICFSSNNFGETFHQAGGIGLSDPIKNIFERINKYIGDNKANLEKIDNDKDWDDFIKEQLLGLGYIHNRVGTPIRDLEVRYIRKNDSRPKIFKTGELVIFEEKFETYKILLVIANNDEKLCRCVGKDSSGVYETKDYSKDLLYKYSEYETIKQDIKPGEPMISQESIVEKYLL